MSPERIKPVPEKTLIFCIFLSSLILATRVGVVLRADPAPKENRAADSYQTELFGKKYRLDQSKDLAAYIAALDTEIARSKREEPLGEAHEKDPLRHPAPKNYIDKKTCHAMEATRAVAVELSTADGTARVQLLNDLYLMAGAVRGAFMRVLPGDMEAFAAMSKEKELRHPLVGLGKDGIATNLSRSDPDPSKADPILPSTYWNRPTDIAQLDLYYGFGRTSLPNFEDVVCTYRHSKQTYGVHAGFDVKCKPYGNVKLKFEKQFSQPFAHRIAWALGFNTTPVDCAPTVKVKWDPRIFTEFNTREDETLTVSLGGILPVHKEHLQHYLDPLQYVSAVVMRDEQGKEVTVRPEPNWDAFKRKLYKNPHGKPETIKDNFNTAFADRIQYLIYKDVNVRLKDDLDDDDDMTYLGHWDWNGEGNPGIRENRAFAFLAAWLNEFDANVSNNKLYMTEQGGKRTLKHYITDIGSCLGRADDATKMNSQSPNDLPWAFTHPARPNDTAIPLDDNFHPIIRNDAFKAADIYDARWIAPYMAQLTGKQILEALIASGMPSAEVRLYFNKLVQRRNKALTDLGFSYAPISPMDESETFDYDPHRDGLISVVTSQNRTVTAPDDDWVVVKGRVCARAEVKSNVSARRIAGAERDQQREPEYPAPTGG
ncbi:MAG TPA: hypothetical protein VKU00_28305 [Chthonomonadaceae bacterium]|nr:hypothetical protein [Chthonomonadaceae bacterium]